MVRRPSGTDVFQAVACPTRRKLLKLLAERQRPVSELVDDLKLRQPSVSAQLRILRETGLVHVEQVGRSRFYRLNPDGFRPLLDWINEFSRFWDTKLDGLAKFLDQNQENS